jgi:hypothetical protein
MKFGKLLLVAAIAIWIGGCSSGSEELYKKCVDQTVEKAQKLAGGKLQADALTSAKTAAEGGCQVCKKDSKQCNMILDSLK